MAASIIRFLSWSLKPLAQSPDPLEASESSPPGSIRTATVSSDVSYSSATSSPSSPTTESAAAPAAVASADRTPPQSDSEQEWSAHRREQERAEKRRRLIERIEADPSIAHVYHQQRAIAASLRHHRAICDVRF